MTSRISSSMCVAAVGRNVADRRESWLLLLRHHLYCHQSGILWGTLVHLYDHLVSSNKWDCGMWNVLIRKLFLFYLSLHVNLFIVCLFHCTENWKCFSVLFFRYYLQFSVATRYLYYFGGIKLLHFYFFIILCLHIV